MGASRLEQRVVVRFMIKVSEPNADIYLRMVAVYGEYYLGRTAVNKLFKSFCEGRRTISDLPRPVQANIVITDDSIATVDAMIKDNQRVQTCDISDELDLSKGTVHTIVHLHLQ
ncbi:uncharacterized protein NPIL_680951 [Nephila pilipes]|uniref:Mos1 transposase HTH domain-containing protein n=1 Tax=Nephila pilipes TaxID=299642 RepID=A0A8X6NKM4_NEPPI|nr:uncharacterized protein NPIL_680951 [Nephila pilipes]